jgi:hypothetical protein
MPLRAYINNEEIISIDQTDEQWSELKKRLKTRNFVLTLPCCKQEGFLRKSNKGLKHFVHSKYDNVCDWKSESPEHLRAKIEIIEACRENRWEAIPEFSGTKWKADVLAIQGEKKIAFVVQWSKQTFEEILSRQDRYKESNVRVCWFFRAAPKELRNYGGGLLANKEIPAFKIFKDEDSNIIAQLKQIQLPLKSLVDNLLKRKLKFCEHIRLKTEQDVTIAFFEVSCWKCGETQHCYTVGRDLLTVCNQNFHLMGSMWESDDIDKNPQIYEAVQQFLKTESGKYLKVGELKKRYSNTVQHSYLSHGCFFCDSIFGDFYLNTEKLYARNGPNIVSYTVKISMEIEKEEEKHWCYSENRQFCE